MHFSRSLLLAALVASSAGFAAIQPAAADSSTAARSDLSTQVRYGDRYDRHNRYDRRHRYSNKYSRHNRHSHRYAGRRCYNDVDIRYRYGHRVRVVERICFRNGRRYVASRRVVRW